LNGDSRVITEGIQGFLAAATTEIGRCIEGVVASRDVLTIIPYSIVKTTTSNTRRTEVIMIGASDFSWGIKYIFRSVTYTSSGFDFLIIFFFHDPASMYFLWK